jgi:hypothetical protein
MWGDQVAPLSKKKCEGQGIALHTKEKKTKVATRPFNWPHGHL